MSRSFGDPTSGPTCVDFDRRFGAGRWVFSAARASGNKIIERRLQRQFLPLVRVGDAEVNLVQFSPLRRVVEYEIAPGIKGEPRDRDPGGGLVDRPLTESKSTMDVARIEICFKAVSDPGSPGLILIDSCAGAEPGCARDQ